MKNKVKIFLLILLVFIALFTLTGCTTYGEKEGKVIDKRFTPTHIVYSYIPIHAGKVTTIMPISRTVKDKYEIKIQKEENETTKECWIEVSKETYEQYEVGDYYKQ